MNLISFKSEKLSVLELQDLKGGIAEIAAEGQSSTTRKTTMCSGSDHDHGKRDSD